LLIYNISSNKSDFEKIKNHFLTLEKFKVTFADLIFNNP